MAKVISRTALKDYCLRKLGWPVIEINVDDDQVEDRIDDSFQFYFDYHYDAVERLFYAHQLEQTDIDNKFITVPDSLIHVTRVLPVNGGTGLFYPMGDPSLAWNSTSANPLFGTGVGPTGGGMPTRTTQDHAGGGSTGGDKVSYYLQMKGIEEFNQMFGTNHEPPIRFSRHTDKVYLDVDWVTHLKVDSYLIVEGWASLDPDVYTDVYNDRWLKRYCTAQIKQQWGANLIKYSGIQLPGGVTLDGDKLYQQAGEEILALEEEMQLKYELPVDFYMG